MLWRHQFVLRSTSLAFAACLMAGSLAFAASPAPSIDTSPKPRESVVLTEARQAFDEGRFEQAATLYGQAGKLEPNNAAAFSGMARSYERLAESSPLPGRLVSKAKKNYQIALNLNPHNVEALDGLIEMKTVPVGVCYGDLNEAAVLVERLKTVDPVKGQINSQRLESAVRDSRTPEKLVRCGYQKVVSAVEKAIPNLPSHSTVR